jgi:hypothetical protein
VAQLKTAAYHYARDIYRHLFFYQFVISNEYKLNNTPLSIMSPSVDLHIIMKVNAPE